MARQKCAVTTKQIFWQLLTTLGDLKRTDVICNEKTNRKKNESETAEDEWSINVRLIVNCVGHNMLAQLIQSYFRFERTAFDMLFSLSRHDNVVISLISVACVQKEIFLGNVNFFSSIQLHTDIVSIHIKLVFTTHMCAHTRRHSNRQTHSHTHTHILLYNILFILHNLILWFKKLGILHKMIEKRNLW